MAGFGLGGGLMLIAGRGTPPVDWLRRSGSRAGCFRGDLAHYQRRGPSASAAYLAYRRSGRTPSAVFVASALLGVALVVQIPFLGFHGLQPAMALIGGTAAGLAWRARARW